MTKHIIEFAYDASRIRTMKDKKTLELENFFLKPPNDLVKLGYLPPVVRSISPPIRMSTQEHRYVVIVERKPAVETMRATNFIDNQSREVTYDIPLPWQHYFVVLSKSTTGGLRLLTMAMYFSQSTLSTLEHRFYVPYLPNVYSNDWAFPCTLRLPNPDYDPDDYDDDYDDHSDEENEDQMMSLENLCFTPAKYSLKDGNFSELFDSVYGSWWHGGTFNQDLHQAPMDFARDYDFATYMEKTKGLGYVQCMYACLDIIKEIELHNILSDHVFGALRFSFTFSDYLKAVGENADTQLFNFKALFKQSLDAGKIIENVEQKYKPFRLSKTSFATFIYQDDQGKFRRADGRFASLTEIDAHLNELEKF